VGRRGEVREGWEEREAKWEMLHTPHEKIPSYATASALCRVARNLNRRKQLMQMTQIPIKVKLPDAASRETLTERDKEESMYVRSVLEPTVDDDKTQDNTRKQDQRNGHDHHF